MCLDNLFIHHVYDILGAQLRSIINNNKHYLKEHNYFNTSYRHLGLRSEHTRVIDHKIIRSLLVEFVQQVQLHSCRHLVLLLRYW